MQAHLHGLTSPNSDLVTQWQCAKEGSLLAHQQGTSHHPPFWCTGLPQPLDKPLLPARRAEATTPSFVTNNTPGGPHTQKGNIYCFLLRTAFSVSHSSIGSRHRKQTAYHISKTIISAPPNTTAIPLAHSDPGHLGWEQGPGAGWESELATFIPGRILQVPSPRQGFVTQPLRKFFLGILRPALTSPATGGSLRRKDVCGLAEVQDARAKTD